MNSFNSLTLSWVSFLSLSVDRVLLKELSCLAFEAIIIGVHVHLESAVVKVPGTYSLRCPILLAGRSLADTHPFPLFFHCSLTCNLLCVAEGTNFCFSIDVLLLAKRAYSINAVIELHGYAVGDF